MEALIFDTSEERGGVFNGGEAVDTTVEFLAPGEISQIKTVQKGKKIIRKGSNWYSVIQLGDKIYTLGDIVPDTACLGFCTDTTNTHDACNKAKCRNSKNIASVKEGTQDETVKILF